MKSDIKSLLPEELEAALDKMGQPKFRAKQIFSWLHIGLESFWQMSNIPLLLRKVLDQYFYVNNLKLLKKQESQEDGTIKFLWELEDGNSVETVFMRYKHGNTVCISSQVGCRMGCAFCASTIGGKVRDLTASEMLDEVLYSQRFAGEKVSNIVLMGIGEPLDNFDNVMRFLKLVNHPDGLNIGMRHISLSTCGLTERIDKLGVYNLQLTLSVSLHAPDDETRNKIMPVNKGVGVDKLLTCCRRYFRKTGRRISFEYAMIHGVNDTEAQARLLARKLQGSRCHVNLIPLNRVAESGLQPSTAADQKRFIEILESAGINVTVRRRLGSDIDASCGQLRRRQKEGKL